MLTLSTLLIIIIVLLAVLFIGRRLLRFAFKLAIVGILVLLLLGGGAYAWWQGWFSSSPQSNQPHNVNRRPANR